MGQGSRASRAGRGCRQGRRQGCRASKRADRDRAGKGTGLREVRSCTRPRREQRVQNRQQCWLWTRGGASRSSRGGARLGGGARVCSRLCSLSPHMAPTDAAQRPQARVYQPDEEGAWQSIGACAACLREPTPRRCGRAVFTLCPILPPPRSARREVADADAGGAGRRVGGSSEGLG